MRIAISSTENRGLDSQVSPHFGRCPYFVLVDVADGEIGAVETVTNPHYSHHQPGQVPAFIHDQGVDVMLTGGMGGRAFGFFEQRGIQAVTGATGTARHTLEQFLNGNLSGSAPCRESIEHGHDQAHH